MKYNSYYVDIYLCLCYLPSSVKRKSYVSWSVYQGFSFCQGSSAISFVLDERDLIASA